jgi:hypothetical protein
VEQTGDLLVTLGLWAGYGLWFILMITAIFLVVLGLPGGWIALGLAVLYDLLWGFDAVGWPALLLFAGLLTVGEVVESLLGTVYVARKGATFPGAVGAFVGAFVGALLGSSVLPVVGTILGSLGGAFLGGVAGEYYRNQQLQPSMRIGWHALVGRVVAGGVKIGLALVGALLVAVRAWPARG